MRPSFPGEWQKRLAIILPAVQRVEQRSPPEAIGKVNCPTTFVHRWSRCTELVQNRDVSCNTSMQTDATLPDDTRTLEHLSLRWKATARQTGICPTTTTIA
jgi:hypothetical protein